MKKILKLTATVFTVASLLVGCSDDNNSSSIISNPEADNLLSPLTLNIDNLEALGDNFTYEGWIIVDGFPVSTGRFSSVTFPQTFQVQSDKLSNATAFELTIEPKDELESELLVPEATKILSGEFNVGVAEINSDNSIISSESSIKSFNNSWGKYILATPTDGGSDTNEESGIWFLDNSDGSNLVGLGLPKLNEGWQYEGWVVLNGVAVSTGTFTELDKADDNAVTSPYKGTFSIGPSFPGEDFLIGSAAGIDFATDLRGSMVVISIEPNPDNSPNPFLLKPLAHTIPTDAKVHNTINMTKGPVVKLTGKVTK